MTKFVVLALAGVILYLMIRRAVVDFVDEADDRPKDRDILTAEIICDECSKIIPRGQTVCPRCSK